MSDEQQQQQQRQQQLQQHQQQQQQQQQIKSPKDTNNSNANTPTTNTPTPPRKSNIHEMRNQDFVSRLMAATPPYLYSAPMGPNNFFFSDMLRSLVAARNQENVRNLQLQHSAALARRPRKRTWSQQRTYFKETETALEKPHSHISQLTQLQTAEKPLELTTHKPYLQHLANKYRKLDTDLNKEGGDVKLLGTGKTKESEGDNNNANPNTPLAGGTVDATLQNTPPAASLPPQDLVLPPPPPVWYPPLYPPYGIDPLHFFIDLRVSGHIYDRKKENISPLASAENTSTTNDATNSPPSATHTTITLPNKHRHGSAFTVPTPRCNELKTLASLQHTTATTTPPTSDAINLSSNASALAASAVNKFENYAKYYDFGESKENQPTSIAKCNANYMLQHLPRLYSQFAARDLIAQAQSESLSHHLNNDVLEADNKSDNDCENESDDRHSIANSDENDLDESSNRERDIDVEIIDSIKYRNDGNSSHCSSPDESSITQID